MWLTVVLFSPKQLLWKIADFAVVAQVSPSSYQPPEFRTETPAYNETMDIWALGCVLHELASGELAFRLASDVENYARSNTRLAFPWLVDLGWQDSDKDALRTILNQTLAVKPYFRLSARRIVDCIQGINQVERRPSEEC